METFHLLYLARLWSDSTTSATSHPTDLSSIPPSHRPADVSGVDTAVRPMADPHPTPGPKSRIRAAAVHMIFASRISQVFITPEEVDVLEEWCGLAVLKALVTFPVSVSVASRRIFWKIVEISSRARCLQPERPRTEHGSMYFGHRTCISNLP